jgi:26S proteasome non-ATPase regulatory subunit 10
MTLVQCYKKGLVMKRLVLLFLLSFISCHAAEESSDAAAAVGPGGATTESSQEDEIGGGGAAKDDSVERFDLLLKYVTDCYLPKLKQLLRDNPGIIKDYGLRGDKKQSVLHVACDRCFVSPTRSVAKVIRLLLQHGAEIYMNTKDTRNYTPLDYFFTQYPFFLEVSSFIEHGAGEFLNQPNPLGNTPLHNLCRLKGYAERVKLIFQHGAQDSIKIKNKKQQTPLHLACSINDIQIVKLLLENGAEAVINDRDFSGRTAYSYASEAKNLKLMQLLFDHGAKDETGQNPSGQSAHAGSAGGGGGGGASNVSAIFTEKEKKAMETLGLVGSQTDYNNLTEKALRKIYRALALIHHPDKPGGDTAKFQIIQNAYEYLLDVKFGISSNRAAR